MIKPTAETSEMVFKSACNKLPLRHNKFQNTQHFPHTAQMALAETPQSYQK